MMMVGFGFDMFSSHRATKLVTHSFSRFHFRIVSEMAKTIFLGLRKSERWITREKNVIFFMAIHLQPDGKKI